MTFSILQTRRILYFELVIDVFIFTRMICRPKSFDEFTEYKKKAHVFVKIDVYTAPLVPLETQKCIQYPTVPDSPQKCVTAVRCSFYISPVRPDDFSFPVSGPLNVGFMLTSPAKTFESDESKFSGRFPPCNSVSAG